MNRAEIKLAVNAMYENCIDGALADKHWDSDFDRAEQELEKSFRLFLGGNSSDHKEKR